MGKPTIWIGFTSAPGLLGDAIRTFEQADVSHAFLAWDDFNFEQRMSLGANWNGVTMQPLARFALDHPRLYQGTRDLWPGIMALSHLINRPYGYSVLLGMSIVEAEKHLLGRVGFNPVRSAAVICSEYVAMVMRKSGYDVLPGTDAGSIDPGDVERWILGQGFLAV